MYIGRRRVIVRESGLVHFPKLGRKLNITGAKYKLTLRKGEPGSLLEVSYQDGSVELVELPVGYYMLTKKALDKLK